MIYVRTPPPPLPSLDDMTNDPDAWRKFEAECKARKRFDMRFVMFEAGLYLVALLAALAVFLLS